MRTPLLAIAAAALLSGSAVAYAQQNAAPVGQTRDHHAQQQAAPAAQPKGATPQYDMRSKGTNPNGPASATERNRNMQNTQMQGSSDHVQGQGSDHLQGGKMLRGGDVRVEGGHNLTIKERTNLRETVLKSGPRATHVNFRIDVGTVVPHTVHLVAVPQQIVAIYPDWSGDLFFTHGDEIVVVEPDTMAIVGVLPL